LTLSDSADYTSFRNAVETHIRYLSKKAMNLRTEEHETLVLKVRVAQLNDILLLATGEFEALP
jgi:hypothetical protein